MGYTDSDADKLQTRINAAAIVNQAVLRCQALDMRMTADNVIICVGDFFDPTDRAYVDLINEVMEALDYTLGIDVKLAAE